MPLRPPAGHAFVLPLADETLAMYDGADRAVLSPSRRVPPAIVGRVVAVADGLPLQPGDVVLYQSQSAKPNGGLPVEAIDPDEAPDVFVHAVPVQPAPPAARESWDREHYDLSARLSAINATHEHRRTPEMAEEAAHIGLRLRALAVARKTCARSTRQHPNRDPGIPDGILAVIEP